MRPSLQRRHAGVLLTNSIVGLCCSAAAPASVVRMAACGARVQRPIMDIARREPPRTVRTFDRRKPVTMNRA